MIAFTTGSARKNRPRKEKSRCAVRGAERLGLHDLILSIRSWPPERHDRDVDAWRANMTISGRRTVTLRASPPALSTASTTSVGKRRGRPSAVRQTTSTRAWTRQRPSRSISCSICKRAPLMDMKRVATMSASSMRAGAANSRLMRRTANMGRVRARQLAGMVNAARAQEIGAASLKKLRVAGVIDGAGEVSVLIIHSHRQAMGAAVLVEHTALWRQGHSLSSSVSARGSSVAADGPANRSACRVRMFLGRDGQEKAGICGVRARARLASILHFHQLHTYAGAACALRERTRFGARRSCPRPNEKTDASQVNTEGLTMTERLGALQALGVASPGAEYRNWVESALYQEAVRRGEGKVAKGGAIVVKTGAHTGRSAKDKFTVRDALTEDTVWWDNNQSMTTEQFDALWSDFKAHMSGRDYFVQDLFGGADETHRVSVRVFNELAWHSLFIRHLLRVPTDAERENFAPQFTIVNLPSFKADPERHGCRSDTVIAVNFAQKLILIGGTEYAGETKKSVFTILNYLLPQSDVLPMHCSVNVGESGDDAAIFFGLSGTGKTTLSADASRTLVGDDEHGWSSNGLFNFEGGCYAKMINPL